VSAEPTPAGRLAAAYPASRHDVELRADGVPVGELTEVLRSESDRLLAEDPTRRRVIFAASARALAVIAAAEDAGFRYVRDVDLAGRDGAVELSLLVREADFVTDADLSEDIPGT
jgi:hypothetical protein